MFGSTWRNKGTGETYNSRLGALWSIHWETVGDLWLTGGKYRAEAAARAVLTLLCLDDYDQYIEEIRTKPEY